AHHSQGTERLLGIGPPPFASLAGETLPKQVPQCRVELLYPILALRLELVDQLHRYQRIHLKQIVAGFNRELGESDSAGVINLKAAAEDRSSGPGAGEIIDRLAHRRA